MQKCVRFNIECNTLTEGFVADAKYCIHGDRLQGGELQIHSRANIMLCPAHAKKTCKEDIQKAQVRTSTSANCTGTIMMQVLAKMYKACSMTLRRFTVKTSMKSTALKMRPCPTLYTVLLRDAVPKNCDSLLGSACSCDMNDNRAECEITKRFTCCHPKHDTNIALLNIFLTVIRSQGRHCRKYH